MNVYKPLIIFNITHSITLLTDGCTNFRKSLIDAMKPNLKLIAGYVDRSLMLVSALSPVIGYDKASKIARHAMDNELTLREAALQIGFLTAEEFDSIVDPKKWCRPMWPPTDHSNKTNKNKKSMSTPANNKRGADLLRDPVLNKSTAHPHGETGRKKPIATAESSEPNPPVGHDNAPLRYRLTSMAARCRSFFPEKDCNFFLTHRVSSLGKGV